MGRVIRVVRTRRTSRLAVGAVLLGWGLLWALAFYGLFLTEM